MPAQPKRTQVRRCGRCNAILTREGTRCTECELMEALPDKPRPKRRSKTAWRGWDFLVGLGIPLDQLASLVIAAMLLLLLAVFTGPVDGLFMGFMLLIWPLAMIWFSDEIGSITGFYRGHYIDQETHPSIIKLIGWVLLLVAVGYAARGMFWT